MRGRPAWLPLIALLALVVAGAALALGRDEGPPKVGERGACILNKRAEQRYAVARAAYERGELGSFEDVTVGMKPVVVKLVFDSEGNLRDRKGATAQGQLQIDNWVLSKPVRAKTRAAQDRAVATVDPSDCE